MCGTYADDRGLGPDRRCQAPEGKFDVGPQGRLREHHAADPAGHKGVLRLQEADHGLNHPAGYRDLVVHLVDQERLHEVELEGNPVVIREHHA